MNNEEHEECFIVIGQLMLANARLIKENTRLQEYCDDREERLFSVEQKLSVVDRDLKEALRRADVSDIGAGTPNPFPTKG